ncbi:class F sortase [Brachybacterium sp. AOP25-B2-12]|uniref:class F sortase n=1 Tax=Brachybacterium sp. AOP25-B2-12 TaxID=3457710 RepID=UPI0040347772
MPPTRHAARPRRSGRALTIVLAVLSVLAVVAGAVMLTHQAVETSEAPKDLDGNAVQLEPADVPPPEVADRMEVQDAPAQGGPRLAIPSASLDVPLGSLLAVDGEITPPGFTQAYAVRNLGVGTEHAADGTVYVVMHSVQHGNAPGNAVIDVDTGAVSVADGAKIQVGDLHYTVTGSLTVGKGELASRADLWSDDPGRLVLITCLQRTEGRSLDNAVIIAQLDG